MIRLNQTKLRTDTFLLIDYSLARSDLRVVAKVVHSLGKNTLVYVGALANFRYMRHISEFAQLGLSFNSHILSQPRLLNRAYKEHSKQLSMPSSKSAIRCSTKWKRKLEDALSVLVSDECILICFDYSQYLKLKTLVNCKVINPMTSSSSEMKSSTIIPRSPDTSEMIKLMIKNFQREAVEIGKRKTVTHTTSQKMKHRRQKKSVGKYVAIKADDMSNRMQMLIPNGSAMPSSSECLYIPPTVLPSSSSSLLSPFVNGFKDPIKDLSIAYVVYPLIVPEEEPY